MTFLNYTELYEASLTGAVRLKLHLQDQLANVPNLEGTTTQKVLHADDLKHDLERVERFIRILEYDL